MSRNLQQQRTQSGSVQSRVQILLTVSGIVLLVAGLALAAGGASISDAIGSFGDDGDDDESVEQAPDENSGSGLELDVNGEDGISIDETATFEVIVTNHEDEDVTETVEFTIGGESYTEEVNSPAGDSDAVEFEVPGDELGEGPHEWTVSVGDTTQNGTLFVYQDGEEVSEFSVIVQNVEDESPIPGASVEIDGNAIGTTGDDGMIDATSPSGQHTIRADADGFQSHQDSFSIDPNTNRITIGLQPQQEEHDVSVVVRDENGNPVENANLQIDGRSLDGNTNANGEYQINGVSEGEHTVTATAEGYAQDEQTITVDGNDDSVELELQTQGNNGGGHTLTVNVQDEDGNPVPNGEVILESDGGVFPWLGGEERQPIRGGTAQFSGLEDGEYTITARSDGYESEEKDIEINGNHQESITLEEDD